MFKTLLVPVDGSENAKHALVVACKLAHQDQARVHILHIPEAVSHETTLVWGAGAVLMEAPPEEVERAGRKLVEGARQEAIEHGIADVDVSIHQGSPARVILDQARSLDADVIVMGSRGLSDIAGLVVGSVSHKVSHTAACEVITVHCPWSSH